MNLTINERIMTLNLLPKQGDITMLRQLRVLKETLSFTDKEKEEWEVIFDEMHGMVKWDDKKVKEVDIEMSERMEKLIAAELRKLNKAQKLDESQVSLWDKFCVKDKEVNKEEGKDKD